jgi:hypothetical protein
MKWFSELTSSHTGTGLQMFEVRDSYATGARTSYGIFIVSQGSFECLDVPCSDDEDVCGRKGKCEKKDFQSKVPQNKNATMTLNYCNCSDYFGGLYCQFNPYSRYAAKHYQEFNANASAGPLQNPSPYEYQALYWEPLFESGASVNSLEVQEGSESDISVSALNGTVVTVYPLNPGEHINTSTAGSVNIFNQSATGEGEL